MSLSGVRDFDSERGRYRSLDGYILDALCDLGRRQEHPSTKLWANQLHNLAAHTGMKELTVRALLHQSASGVPGTLEMARLLGADIANPLLGALEAGAT